ncbi:MAG: hypothetical protein AABY76_10235, partial [Planctomycetota bacterium]
MQTPSGLKPWATDTNVALIQNILRVNTRVEKSKFSVHKREYEALPETMMVVPLRGDVMFPHVVRQLHL